MSKGEAVIVDVAAIRVDEGTVYQVPRPGRHHNVIQLIREAGYEGHVNGPRQGFVLSDGRFVGREEALAIALESGQVKLEGCHAPGVGLFSEDLW